MKSSEQMAREWGMSKRTINDLCNKGKILGAIKVGRQWQIPDGAEKPVDGRVSSGKYAKKENGNTRLLPIGVSDCTGILIFVSRFVANYFKKDNEVYVLNRNTHSQLEGVHLIEADRHNIGDKLKDYKFDAVIDVCAYTGEDVNGLLDALNDVDDYILISSSAVYPETNRKPFTEEQSLGVNSIWGP